MDAALVQPTSVRDEALGILSRLGAPQSAFAREGVTALSPITGEIIAQVRITGAEEVSAAIGRAAQAFEAWRTVPAPRRGEFVRVLAEELRAAKDDLGRLVTLETGKIVSEGLGEVQEMIDICDFAVGLSRQLYGRTIATERADHRMMETWHPLGVCGVISAFNFPVAVWSWNAALAFVCGDPVVWKPSEKTPLTALATQAVVERAMQRFGDAPDGLSAVLIGGRDVGEALVDDARVAGRIGHRFDRHGPCRRPASRRPFRPRDPGARRQQRRHRRAVGRSRSRGPRHRLRGDGHGGPALHHAAAAVRA